MFIYIMFYILVILIYLKFTFPLSMSKLLDKMFHCTVEASFDKGMYIPVRKTPLFPYSVYYAIFLN